MSDTPQISAFFGSLFDFSDFLNSFIVSATHVEAAAHFLARFNKGKWKDFNNTVSGILLGAMVSNLFGYLFLDVKISTAGVVFTIVCGAVGAFMVGVNYKNDV